MIIAVGSLIAQTSSLEQLTGELFDVPVAALTLSEKDSIATQVGRYDLQTFKFDPVLTVPGLRFTSMDLWVDEQAKLVYITVNGDLLSLPLP